MCVCVCVCVCVRVRVCVTIYPMSHVVLKTSYKFGGGYKIMLIKDYCYAG